LSYAGPMMFLVCTT